MVMSRRELRRLSAILCGAGVLISATVFAASAPTTPGTPALMPPTILPFPIVSGTFFPGVGPQATGTTSTFVFTNTSNAASTPTITLYAGDTGAKLGTYTTPSVAALGALRVNVSDVIAGVTPALTVSQAAGSLDADIGGGFRGDVKLVSASATDVADLSSCSQLSNARILGGVAGPGNTAFTDGIRVANASAAPHHITLTIRDAANGSSLGTWTSADVPGHGSITVSSTALAAAATPPVAATKTNLVIVPGPMAFGMSLRHLSQVKGQTAVADLTGVCSVFGFGPFMMHAAPVADENTDSDQTDDTK